MTVKLVQFFEERPEIQKKYIYPGTFRDFAGDIAGSVKPKQKKSALQKAIVEEISRILSDQVSLETLEAQVINSPIMSTADHHGLLHYKLLYNSNILYSEIIKELKLPFMVVLSSGSVPLKNISHPRGFHFKDRKFNFFGEKQSKVPVYLFQGKLEAERQQGIDSFLISYNKEILTIEERKFLEFLFFDCLELEKTGKDYDFFSDQITFLNYKLWKYFFNKNIRAEIPDMIYLQANRIILIALLDEIKKDDSLINKIIFDPAVRKVYLNNFSGLPGCWGENMGSHLFWGIIERKKKTRFTPLRLDESSNSLIGENFKLVLEREAIVEALMNKKILPTLFFDTLIVTFLEGYMALGGLNQIEYLPKMQDAHVDSLKDIGMQDMADRFATPIAGGLICGMYPFQFGSSIDMLWNYNSDRDKFSGNLDGGLTQRDLDKMSEMSFTELLSTGIDTTLGIG